MSNNVFPALPIRKIGMRRAKRYRVSIFETESGAEQRFIHGPTPRRPFTVTYSARDAKAAPAPWQAYSELAIVEKFEDDHYGEGDSFLWVGPDAVQRRVRFAGQPAYTELVPGVWNIEVTLITVI